MYEIKTQISFEAAHRLYNVNTYSEACRKNLHGHSYKVILHANRNTFDAIPMDPLTGKRDIKSGPALLDSSGMVVDFKLLKEIVKDVIEDPFDHSCILNSADPLCKPISENCENVHIVDENPTAEWMAKHFFELVNEALAKKCPQVIVRQVEVQETENNVAIYER